MLHRRRARAAMRQVVLLLLLPGWAAASTALFLDSDSGDGIGQGRHVVRTTAAGTFQASGGATGVQVQFSAGTSFWNLSFAPPAGGLLAPGAYEAAQRWPFQSSDHPGLDVSGDGRGCNELQGRFVVRVAEFGMDGQVIAFAVDFEQHCDAAAPALFGTLLYTTGDAACGGQPDGTPCDDGDTCTTGDQCAAGVCRSSTVCGAETSCSVPYCTARTAACIAFDRPDDTSCDDGNPATTLEVCTQGACVPPTSTTLCMLSATTPTSTLPPAFGAAARVPPAIDRQRTFSSARPAVWPAVPAPAARSGIAPAVAGRQRTIPHFADTFSYGGQTYSYQMVGTNPRRSKRRTVIPTVIVPVRFAFADGSRFDPARTTGQLRRSPVFRRSTFGSDTTQYGDAVQRAEFWSYTQGTGYHVLLGHPAVTKTVTITVPSIDGFVAASQYGGAVGVVSESYFSGRVVPAIVNHLRLSPSKLIIFWSYDTVFSPPAGQSGVYLGEHSAGTDRARTTVWTWVWASWHTPDTAAAGEADVAALSHEIAEWYNDPFGSNVVPGWQAPAYPCNDLLEVGDPLVGTTFVQDGFHLQDEAFLSWFARQVPSTGLDGMYSLLGTFTAPPPVCTGSCADVGLR